MTEETTTEVQEQSDKELNFNNLKESHAAELAARDELINKFRPAAINDTVREVGLDPNKGNGLVLKDLLGENPDVEKAKELVARYGWDAPTATRSDTEQQAINSANRLAELQGVTSSDAPLDPNKQIADLQEQIAAAKASGNTLTVSALNSQLITLMNRQSLSAGVRP